MPIGSKATTPFGFKAATNPTRNAAAKDVIHPDPRDPAGKIPTGATTVAALKGSTPVNPYVKSSANPATTATTVKPKGYSAPPLKATGPKFELTFPKSGPLLPPTMVVHSTNEVKLKHRHT